MKTTPNTPRPVPPCPRSAAPVGDGLRRRPHAQGRPRPHRAGPYRGRHVQTGRGSARGSDDQQRYRATLIRAPESGSWHASTGRRPRARRGQPARGRDPIPPRAGIRAAQRARPGRIAHHRAPGVGRQPGEAGTGRARKGRHGPGAAAGGDRAGHQPAPPGRSKLRAQIDQTRSSRRGSVTRPSSPSCPSRCRWSSATPT